MGTYSLYIHINKTNNKVYVGYAANPIKRWGNNGNRYTQNKYFYKEIQEYGWDGFYHIIICSTTDKEYAKFLEKYYIALYNANNPHFGYNKTIGGDGYNLGKNSLSPESRREQVRKSKEKDPERANQWHRNWIARNEEPYKNYQKEWKEQHKEETREYMRQYRESKRQEIKEYMKRYHERKKQEKQQTNTPC